jgi:hypothetical protein
MTSVGMAPPRSRRRGARWAVASAVSLGLVVGGALPAFADALETGTQSCGGSTPFSWVQGKTKGDRGLKGPGTGSYVYTLGLSTTTWTTGVRQGITGGGAWGVYGTVGVDTDYSKGYCTAFG